MDCFDGVVFRAHSKTQRYKSYYGDFGYYVDAISDILGGTCLILGCFFYFYKQRPIRSISIRSNSNSLSNETDETDLLILNLEHDSSSTTNNELNNNLFETKRTIFLTLLLFSLRYILAAYFWDRYVHGYEDLLDTKLNTLQEQV